MSFLSQDNREYYTPAHADEQLAIDVYDAREAVLSNSNMESRVDAGVKAVERLSRGVASNDIYRTVDITALAHQTDIEVAEDAQIAAEQVMYPYDMISRDPLPRHNEYIDTLEKLNPEGKPVTPKHNIDHIRAEVERQSDTAITNYALEGMNEMEAFLSGHVPVGN